MPYIINDPLSTCAYITNNPIIFMDCRAWGWHVESRRYSDEECRKIQDWEDKYGLSERRERELNRLWSEELQKRQERAGDEVRECEKAEFTNVNLAAEATVFLEKEVRVEAVQEMMREQARVEEVEEVGGRDAVVRDGISIVAISKVTATSSKVKIWPVEDGVRIAPSISKS
ncbi:hypothetical protein K505DRAFT_367458 [Melanomma pulvis-pyrius CBS 109.77]|uniref:Uncharacterized protein n=1 Tax=Melanomma pulvis-pyrius CBS 109.77 TaxID=1314802 RepID=A0A6A6WTX5_9PLEO|nr:hypothetical protein K505DRAFT_367458 [Melanomma pulvis-pyrius CBS 109.77]